jgi:hypothetical protein
MRVTKARSGMSMQFPEKTDRVRQALQGLERRSGQQYVPTFATALVYTGVGDHDHAISWLQKAYEG